MNPDVTFAVCFEDWRSGRSAASRRATAASARICAQPICGSPLMRVSPPMGTILSTVSPLLNASPYVPSPILRHVAREKSGKRRPEENDSRASAIGGTSPALWPHSARNPASGGSAAARAATFASAARRTSASSVGASNETSPSAAAMSSMTSPASGEPSATSSSASASASVFAAGVAAAAFSSASSPPRVSSSSSLTTNSSSTSTERFCSSSSSTASPGENDSGIARSHSEVSASLVPGVVGAGARAAADGEGKIFSADAETRSSPRKPSPFERAALASSRVITPLDAVFFATDAHEPSDSDASENPSTSAKNCFCCSSLERTAAASSRAVAAARASRAPRFLSCRIFCAFFSTEPGPPQSLSLSLKGPS